MLTLIVGPLETTET